MTHEEIVGAALTHKAVAVLKKPRKSSHSFTGWCVDVFFDDPQHLVKFQEIIEILIGHFVAISYESEYARVRIPCQMKK